MDWLTTTLVVKFILGSIIAICAIVLVARMLEASNVSLPKRTSHPVGAAPTGGAQPTRVVERTVVRSESSRPSGSGGMIFGLLFVALLVWLIFFGGWDRFVSLGDGQSVDSAHVENEPGLPSRGSVPVPATGGSFSKPVYGKAGFTLCRVAELGPGSFDTEYKASWDAKWLPLPPGGAAGIAERYVSRTRAQQMEYHYARSRQDC